MDEIDRLNGELAVAANTDATQQRLYEENTWLRELLGNSPGERIAAAVIARPNQLPYDYLQIDRGTDHGVAVGAPVYTGVDTVIGLVSHTDRNFSFVELFTTPDFEATAFVSGVDIVVTVEGFGGGVARVRVPQGIPLTVGSIVHIPSIDPGVFGRISYIESEPTQPEQYGYITLEKSSSSLHYVAVGKDPLIVPDETAILSQIESIVNDTLKIDGMNTTTAPTSTPAITEPNDTEDE